MEAVTEKFVEDFGLPAPEQPVVELYNDALNHPNAAEVFTDAELAEAVEVVTRKCELNN